MAPGRLLQPGVQGQQLARCQRGCQLYCKRVWAGVQHLLHVVQLLHASWFSFWRQGHQPLQVASFWLVSYQLGSLYNTLASLGACWLDRKQLARVKGRGLDTGRLGIVSSSGAGRACTALQMWGSSPGSEASTAARAWPNMLWLVCHRRCRTSLPWGCGRRKAASSLGTACTGSSWCERLQGLAEHAVAALPQALRDQPAVGPQEGGQ